MIFLTLILGGLSDLIPTIQNIPPVTIVCSSFDVTVLTIDTSDNSVSSVTMTITVKLKTQSGSVISSKNCDLSDTSGCTLTGFSISSSGKYSMSVLDESSNLLSQTSEFDVISDLQVISLSSSSLSPSANFIFTVTAKLQDLCNKLITTSTEVTISPSFSLIGVLSQTTTTGSSLFTLRSETSGDLTITASVGSLSSVISLTILQNLLKITSISPTPFIENSVFTVTAKVYSNSGSAVVSSFGPFSLTLSLFPTGDISGNLTQDTSNGVAVFSVLIISSGTFHFEVTSNGMITGNSKDFLLEAAVLTSLITDISAFNVSVNQDFIVNVNAFDQISRIWWKTCTVDASSDDSLAGGKSLTNTSGNFQFSLRFSVSGLKILKFSSELATVDVSVNVLKNVLKIKSVSPTPMFVESSFDVFVQVFRNDLMMVEESYGIYELNLESVPADGLNGVLQKSTSSGKANFTGLEFRKTGSFSLVFSGNDLVDATSASFYIIEIVLSSINTEYPKVLTVGFEFSFNVTIRNQFGNLWTRSTEIVLAINLEVSGPTQLTTTTGKSSFPLKFLKSGIAQIIITAGLITKPIFLTINQRTILIQYENQEKKDHPFFIQSPFWISTSIKDYSGENSSSTSGETLVLLLLNSGQIHKSYSGSTSSGSLLFSNIEIDFPGVFQVLASASNCLNSTLSLPKFIFGPASLLQISNPPDPVKTKYFSSFSLKILNSTENLLPYSVTFSIFNSNSELLTSGLAESGTGHFLLVFNETGEILLKARVEDVETFFKVQVFKGNNSDELCAVAVGEFQCVQCRDEASQVVNGSCSCVFLSIFNESTQKCECQNDLKPSNGFCVACGRYLRRSDLYAYYSEDYRKIIVISQKTIDFKGLDSCVKILAEDSDLFKYSPSCSWVNSWQVEISLKKYPDLQVRSFELNNTNLVTIKDECSYSVERLNLEINLLFPLPTLQVTITAPDVFSTQCSDEGLVLKSSTFSTEMSFSWKVLSEASESLRSFIENSTLSVLVLPKELLKEGELFLSLTCRIDALNVNANAFKTVKITKDKTLMLDFNVGSFITVLPQNPVVLEVVSIGSCFEVFPLFSWKSEKIADFDLLVNSSKVNHRLVIPPNTLQAGWVYSVEASSEKITLKTKIQVNANELVLILSRSSGSIPLDRPLVLNVEAQDPDDSSAQFVYSWSCSQDFLPCLTRFGQEIEFSKEKEMVKISNYSLIDGKSYRFQVIVKTSSKTATRFVILTVDSNLKGSIEVPSINPIISHQSLVKIVPTVNLNENSQFSWQVQGGKFDSRQTDMKKPFFCALGKQFEQGKIFKFKLFLNDDKEIASFEAKTKLGPDCQEFQVSEFQEFLYLTGKLCWDLDDQDYPLKYQFGGVGKKKFLFGNSDFFNEYYTAGLPDMKTMIMVLCDASNMCKGFEKDLKKYRRLGEDEGKNRYLEYLNNGRNVPESILALDGKDLNDYEFKVLFSAFFKYFDQEFQDNLEIFSETLKIVEKFQNFDGDYFEKVYPIIEKYLEKINFNSENTDDIMELLYSFRYYLKKSRFFYCVSVILTQVSENYLPVHSFEYDSKFIALLTRTFSNKLDGFSTSLNNFKLTFPPDLKINSSEVIDIQVIFCDFNETFYFLVSVNTSGTYISFNYESLPSVESDLKLDSGIVLEIKNNLFSLSACGDSKHLSTKSCKFSSSSEGYLKIHLYKTGYFSVYEDEKVCTHEEIGVLISSVIFGFALLWSLGIILLNLSIFKPSKKISSIKDEKLPPRYSIVNLIPITSVFQRQGQLNRITSIHQLSSSILLLLSGLKLTSFYLFSSSTDEKFSSKDLLSGLIPFLISQPFTFINLMLQNNLKSSKAKPIPMISSILFSILSLSYQLFLYFSKCKNLSYNWVLNLLFFGLFELFLMHPLYAFICLKTNKTTSIYQVQTQRGFTFADEAVSGRSENLGAASVEEPEEEGTDNLHSPKANPQPTLSGPELESLFESRKSKSPSLKIIKDS